MARLEGEAVPLAFSRKGVIAQMPPLPESRNRDHRTGQPPSKSGLSQSSG